MSSASFFRFLSDSLRVLEREMPASYRSVARHLGDRALRFEIDGNGKTLRFIGTMPRWEDADLGADVLVASDRETVLALLRGALSLEESLLSDRLRLYGSIATLDRFHQALDAYLHGAVRSPSFPPLLETYESRPSQLSARRPP